MYQLHSISDLFINNNKLASSPVVHIKDRESIPKTLFQKVIFLHFLVPEPNHLHSAKRITLSAIVSKNATFYDAWKGIFPLLQLVVFTMVPYPNFLRPQGNSSATSTCIYALSKLETASFKCLLFEIHICMHCHVSGICNY